MPTLDEIVRQIKDFDKAKHILKRREINELPGILRNDEKIEKIASVKTGNYKSIIVATDQRILFINKSMFTAVKSNDYPYDRIERVKIDKKVPFLRECELCIFPKGKFPIVIVEMDKVLAAGIRDFIQSKISSSEE